MLKINIGDKFGRLKIVREAEEYVIPSGEKKRRFLCKCICGTEKTVRLDHLKSGNTKSCGCFNIEKVRERRINYEKSSEYKAFHDAKARCQNPKNKFYYRYGGRGIKFLFKSFEDFLKEIGRKPSPELQLDREDNDSHYMKGNIRWITRKEQVINKSNNHFLEFKGERLTISQWSKKFGLNRNTITSRLNRGWSIEKVLTTKIN